MGRAGTPPYDPAYWVISSDINVGLRRGRLLVFWIYLLAREKRKSNILLAISKNETGF